MLPTLLNIMEIHVLQGGSNILINKEDIAREGRGLTITTHMGRNTYYYT